MAATSIRELVLASVRTATARHAEAGVPLDGIVCGNTEADVRVYDHTETVEVEDEDGTIQTVEQRASVADYLRTMTGPVVAAVNWYVAGGEVTRISFMAVGAELIDNWDGSGWELSDMWEV